MSLSWKKKTNKPNCCFTKTFGNFGTKINRAKFQFLGLFSKSLSLCRRTQLAKAVLLAGDVYPGLPNIVPISQLLETQLGWPGLLTQDCLPPKIGSFSDNSWTMLGKLRQAGHLSTSLHTVLKQPQDESPWQVYDGHEQSVFIYLC